MWPVDEELIMNELEPNLGILDLSHQLLVPGGHCQEQLAMTLRSRGQLHVYLDLRALIYMRFIRISTVYVFTSFKTSSNIFTSHCMHPELIQSNL